MGKVIKGQLTKFFLFVLTVLVFLGGCQKKQILSRVYDESEIGAKIVSVSVLAYDQNVSNNVATSLKKEKMPVKKDSVYTIECNFSYYGKKCNNPLMKSYETDFDGFIRFSLLKENRRIYMCQKDFKGEAKQYMFDELMEELFDDMDIDVSKL